MQNEKNWKYITKEHQEMPLCISSWNETLISIISILSVVAEEQLNSREEVTLQFSGAKLKKMNWFFAKSDPFLEISK